MTALGTVHVVASTHTLPTNAVLLCLALSWIVTTYTDSPAPISCCTAAHSNGSQLLLGQMMTARLLLGQMCQQGEPQLKAQVPSIPPAGARSTAGLRELPPLFLQQTAIGSLDVNVRLQVLVYQPLVSPLVCKRAHKARLHMKLSGLCLGPKALPLCTSQLRFTWHKVLADSR
jgi:hypothetical protein